MALHVVDPWTGTVGCVSDDVFAGGWEEVRDRLESRCQCYHQRGAEDLGITPDLAYRAWKDLEEWFGVEIRAELTRTTPAEIVRIWLQL